MELQEFVGVPFSIPNVDGFFGDYRVTSWANNSVTELGPLPALDHGLYPGLCYVDPFQNELLRVIGDTWTDRIIEDQHQQSGESQLLPLTVVSDMEEDMGIRLVHALLTCAESIQRGELQLASSLINETSNWLMTRVNTANGIGKVAAYFIDAMSRRLYEPSLDMGVAEVGLLVSSDILYHHFYEACPYLKFAHFTANQAILEAFEGHTSVHVIDFNLMLGLQWPALIQALALRPGGPPSLKLTAIHTSSLSNGYDHVFHETGLRLAQLARSINLNFSFRVVTSSQLEDIKPWMVQTSSGEAIAVNSILQFHQLLGSNIDSFLKSIRSLNPKIVTIVEQEANHNQPDFLVRFTEALHYYSAIFDSLEDCQNEGAKPLVETYMQREICNILCCEGSARVERHESLAKWCVRMSQAEFKPVHMGYNALKQANMLLTLCSTKGYILQEIDGCLTLGWHNRPLFSASAWQVRSDEDAIVNVTHDGQLSSSSSS